MKFLNEIPKSLTGRHYGRNSDGGMGFNTALRDRVEKLRLEEDFFVESFGKRANSLIGQAKTNQLKTPKSGYQEGFIKGSSFATVFDKREYYETFIRRDNNNLFGPGMQDKRNRR